MLGWRQLLHATPVVVIAVALRWAQIATHITQQPPTKTPPPPPPHLPRTADGVVLLAPSELSKYTGIDDRPIYLAIIGDVFDVSTGARHYAEGHSYAHMAGRDASRSFATGEHDGIHITDDLSGLDDEMLNSIGSWHEFFVKHENYTRVGRVHGRFYDADGASLGGFPWERLKAAEKRGEQLKRDFPGCNSRWTQATGSEVWCTTKSGGQTRDWVGVPRLLDETAAAAAAAAAASGRGSDSSGGGGDAKPKERCACVPVELAQRAPPYLRPYDECAPDAERCKVVKKKR